MPEVAMPKMGDAMEEGTILRWLVKEGDRVEEGQPLAEIQTEKANIEIESSEAGVIQQFLVKEGQTVPVGTAIALVGGPNGSGPAAQPPPEKKSQRGSQKAPPPEGRPGPDGEQIPGSDAPAPPRPTADHPEATRQQPAGAFSGPEPGGGAAQEGRVKASPLARKVAAEHGVSLQGIEGTGPGGRIIEADVAESLQRSPAPAAGAAVAPIATAAGPAAPPLQETQRPMSTMRKLIARRLLQSKQTIPHFYLTLDVDMRAAARVRGEYNGSVDESRKISVNDLVLRACALGLLKFPQVNSRLDGEVIKTAGTINMGIAVSLDEGLIVPVIRDAQTKSIAALAQEVRALADRARRGQLKPEEYSGGTFTVSNLGMYDITQFQAVINPPEAAILAVGAIRETPIVENGQIVPGKQMHLTISVDHRLVDGAVAAQFLQEVKRLLQGPMSLFG